jgi:formate/nitrite transporter FocA (FNT family)
MIFRFEIPAIFGNIVGGVVLVAMLNHGQVSKSRES